MSSTVIPKPQVHYSADLTRYGSNPYGEPLYRVVFAPSVRHLVGGRWRDGAVEYRSRPTYGHIGNEWVLERWVPAHEYCGMSQSDYEIRFRNETGLFTMGPYPSNGTYVMCMDSPIKVEAISTVGKLIEGIEHGRRNASISRSAKNKELIAADLIASEKAKDDFMLDKIKESRPAFGNRPTSFAPTKHSQGVHSTKSNVVLDKKAPFNITPGSLRAFKETENA